MPWWATIYIVALSALSLGGVAEQFRNHQKVHGFATLISLIMFVTFVFAYYKPEVDQIIGLWVLPMLILVAVYDLWLANLDLEPQSKFFMKKLPDVESRMGNVTALAILLPAYAAGIMVTYRQLVNV